MPLTLYKLVPVLILNCKILIFRNYLQAVANGIESVQSIIKENNIDGVYGPLIENFTCEDKYFVAVEVTAGNK